MVQQAPVLKYGEMMWLFDDGNGHQTYLGEAGNLISYSMRSQVSAMRIGDIVVTQDPRHPGEDNSHELPLDTVLRGFREDIDGKTLEEVLVEGIHYDWSLCLNADSVYYRN